MQEVLNLTPSTHAHLTYGYRQRQQKDIKITQKYDRNMAKTVLNHNNKIQEKRKINLLKVATISKIHNKLMSKVLTIVYLRI